MKMNAFATTVLRCVIQRHWITQESLLLLRKRWHQDIRRKCFFFFIKVLFVFLCLWITETHIPSIFSIVNVMTNDLKIALNFIILYLWEGDETRISICFPYCVMSIFSGVARHLRAQGIGLLRSSLYFLDMTKKCTWGNKNIS